MEHFSKTPNGVFVIVRAINDAMIEEEGLMKSDNAQPHTPVHLFTQALRFDASGGVQAGERRMGDGDDWQLVVFHVETDEDVHSDYWERHPSADEAVCCLRGCLRVYLRDTGPDGDEELVTLETGEALIVPRDRWHRLEIDEPNDLMVVTLRDGSQLQWRGALASRDSKTRARQ